MAVDFAASAGDVIVHGRRGFNNPRSVGSDLSGFGMNSQRNSGRPADVHSRDVPGYPPSRRPNRDLSAGTVYRSGPGTGLEP